MLASIGFLIRECWLNIRRQGLMTLACISTAAVALTILGAFMVLAWHIHGIAERVPRQLEVHAFVRADATREQSVALVDQVKQLPGVTSVRLVTKEEAWAQMRKTYANPSDLEGLQENPLPDKLEIRTELPSQTLSVADAIRNLPQIDEVKEERTLLKNLLAIANVIRIAGMVGIALLALGTASIVGNAIKMTLYARRRDIRVMQLVGATNGAIRTPFLLEGIAVGALGGGIAFGVMAGGLRYFDMRVLPSIPFIAELHMSISIPLLCGVLVGGGAALGMFGSLVSLRRFLKAA